jgi:cysteine desulfurase
LPGAAIVGAAQPRLWNTVSALMPETEVCQRWVVKLDKLGFAVSTGSACASGKEAPSHVLSAMGFTPDQAARALRFSAGWETTHDDWQQLLAGLREVYAGMRSGAAV